MLSDLVNTIVVPQSACIELRLDGSTSLSDLHVLPEELHLVERAVPKRVMQFAAGRHCARLAAEQLGQNLNALLRGEFGEPLWPAGLKGSITHCDGCCSALVSKDPHLCSVGIDIEPFGSLSSSVLEMIASEKERRMLQESWGSESLGKLLFCCKEAVLKAIYPLDRQKRFLESIQIRWDLDQHTFCASADSPVFQQNGTTKLGKFIMSQGFLSAIYMIRDGSF
jgi:4'-phosphopantetheinyl transferase EntD